MTTALSVSELATRLKPQFGEAVNPSGDSLLVKKELLGRVAEFVKATPGLDFDYLDMITAVDYPEYFELVYRLVSLRHNHSLILKTRCTRTEPRVPSLANLWQGAGLQEREIYDLFGIGFEGHPNLKRIVLWEGFEGYPLRKDFRHGA